MSDYIIFLKLCFCAKWAVFQDPITYAWKSRANLTCMVAATSLAHFNFVVKIVKTKISTLKVSTKLVVKLVVKTKFFSSQKKERMEVLEHRALSYTLFSYFFHFYK